MYAGIIIKLRRHPKILTLSYDRKIMGGWTNYSCVVKSKNISDRDGIIVDLNQNLMLLFLSLLIIRTSVKEQRVNDIRNTSYLKCTLLNFERSPQFIIPIKLINKSRFYSSNLI